VHYVLIVGERGEAANATIYPLDLLETCSNTTLGKARCAADFPTQPPAQPRLAPQGVAAAHEDEGRTFLAATVTQTGGAWGVHDQELQRVSSTQPLDLSAPPVADDAAEAVARGALAFSYVVLAPVLSSGYAVFGELDKVVSIDRRRTGAGGDNGIAKCRIVGKSQPDLITIDPTIFTCTRIHTVQRRHSARHSRCRCPFARAVQRGGGVWQALVQSDACAPPWVQTTGNHVAQSLRWHHRDGEGSHDHGDGAAAVASFLAAVLTEVYLCSVCSCQAILRRNGRGQGVEAEEVHVSYSYASSSVGLEGGGATRLQLATCTLGTSGTAKFACENGTCSCK
jgi:hypothetical protein